MLTTSTSRFVDIRIYHHPCTPDDPGLPHHAKSLQLLQWAFAGTSSVFHNVDPSDPIPEKCTWEHWIDSRVVLGAEPQEDTASMLNVQDGMSLEKGSMRNAAGKVLPYEELWIDLPVESTNLADPKQKISILTTMDQPDRNARGIIARVGRWIQGIVTKDNEVSVERWKWREETENFERISKIGRLLMPCLIVFDEDGNTKVGQTWEVGGLAWKVVEKHEWTD